MEWMIGWWQASVQRVYPTKLSCLKPITVLLSSGISIFIFVISMLIESYGDRYKAQIFSLISKRTQPFVIAVLAPQLSALHLLKPLPQNPHYRSRSFHPRCLIKHINNSVRQMFFIKSVIAMNVLPFADKCFDGVMLTCWNTCLIQ